MSEQPKTVRVRIAVNISAKGEWAASGNSRDKDDKERASVTYDMLDNDPALTPEHVVFVEADVPLPVAQTVEGRVQP